jgi:predicted ATPase/DNA-binding SARP family transcriptional activator
MSGELMGEMEFFLLGPVEVWNDGRSVAVGGPRQRSLLALLLLEPGAAVTPARLADDLWDGRPPAGAESSLRSYMSRLRRVLGADVVDGGRTGYRLAVRPTDIDARRFEQLLREGRDALAAGREETAAEQLAAALALWRGPALVDVAESGALATEARRLNELRLACLEDRIEADLALDRHAVLVPELQVLVERHPLRERLRRLLMLALYRSERQADALEAARMARRVLDSELGLEPSEELHDLEMAILRHEVEHVETRLRRHNLPAEGSSFVGRHDDVAAVGRLLREHRLVTITGLGGVGKTRLALEIARHEVDNWRDGVWLVDLTAVADPGLVPPVAARAVGADHATIESLLARMRDRDALIVLDNCEHLVGACAELADALLRDCPDVRMLATSRSSLGASGEVDYALPPLSELEAVQLFAERAAAVRRDLREDEPALVTICRELDGLPLAIELAAARATVLSLAEIASRLDDRFRFLRAWHRVADPRHRTLQTTMDWSYELLAEEERSLLRHLSVFAGGADLRAVTMVCADGDDLAAIELLTQLVDASLVRPVDGPSTRYRLLETVRHYAAARLAEDPERNRVHRRHAEHYLALAKGANLAVEATGRSGPQEHEPVLREQHNLRAAIDWSAHADLSIALELMVALENFWIAQALDEGAARFRALLAHADDVDPHLLARATRDHASCLDVLGDFAAAMPLYERSRKLFADLGDELGVAYLDYRIAIVVRLEGHFDRARQLCLRSLETFRRLGDASGELQVLGVLGNIEVAAGDADRGREMQRASIEMAHAAGWHWWETRYQGVLADDAIARGDTDEAEERGRAVVRLASRSRNRQDVLWGLALLARAAALRGDAPRALALWATVEVTEDQPGRMGKFDRAAYAAEMPAGPARAPLALADAVALALDD